MTNLSLNPIFDSFAPIFKQLRTDAMSALLIAPIAMNHPIRQTAQSVNIYRLQVENNRLSDQEISNLIDMVKAVSAITDFIIASITPDSLSIVTLDDILTLESTIKKYDSLTHRIMANNQSQPLSSTLCVFSNKMHTLCNMMKAEKYKQQSDDVVLSRLYRTSEDIGYTYTPSHSFDDFKKAMMM